MTLLDFPNKVACTVFTGGCNLRCPFCHNARLVTEIDASETVAADEILSFLKKRTGLLDGVCITGGEPLLQSDIEDFIREVKALGFALKLDTNGCFPDKLAALTEKGLVDYVAMDIKNSPDKYAETVGIKNFDLSPVKKSVSILKDGKTDYEFRTTVVREFHTEESIEAAAESIAGAKRYFLQNFVDSGNLISGEGMSGLTGEELENALAKAKNFIPQAQIRGEK